MEEGTAKYRKKIRGRDQSVKEALEEDAISGKQGVRGTIKCPLNSQEDQMYKKRKKHKASGNKE